MGFILIAFVVSLFAGRLLQLQGLDASEYALQAIKSRLTTVALHAQRGEITDRTGVPLATTVDTVAVAADPSVTKNNAGKLANLLAPVLGVSVLELEDKLSKKDRRYVLLARHVDPEKWAATRKKLEDVKGGGGVSGDRDPLRTYPAKAVASNVLGFVGHDGKGLAGIEQSMDSKLHGVDGWSRYERYNGAQIPMGSKMRKDPKPGADLSLTLDRDVQWKAQQSIDQQVRKTKAESGSVVVLDAKTGELLAMATSPGFDPNNLSKSQPENRGNRVLGEVYEPGSVAKIVTAASLLEEGYVKPETKITVPSSLHYSGKRIGDWWTHGTERLTFAGAIARSSNIGTVLAAESMPKKTQLDYIYKFGLGKKTGIGFPAESAGLVRPLSEWTDQTRATVSFGQGISVNAVQMASAVGTIANGGVRVAPTLVRGTLDDRKKLIPAPRPKSARVVSTRTADQVTEMMEAVTGPGGLAEKAAGIPGYRVAGKTGTAQRADPKCNCYNGFSASFAGFAPADKGRYVVYVVLHNPQGNHSGSGVAAPVFKDVMTFVLQKYAVAPTGAKTPEIPLTW